MKRLIWTLRFSPGALFSGLALCLLGGVMLFLGPPVVPAGIPAISVIWMFGDIPWYLACIVGALKIYSALYLGPDAYRGF